MNTNHTPGPWHVVEYAGYYALQQEAYYNVDDDLLNAEKCPQAAANARLAAAAPELLTMLQRIAITVRFRPLSVKELEEIDALLAKAEKH